MSNSEKTQTPTAIAQDDEEGFLARWSRVKREQREHNSQTSAPPAAPQEKEDAENAPPPLTDEDMPPLDSLSGESDLQPFLSSGVSDSLRRKAFRKIFLNPQFNIRDGLDDYDEDFTNFTALGDVVTSEYRRWRERMEAAQEREQEATEATEAAPTQPAAAEAAEDEDASDSAVIAENQDEQDKEEQDDRSK